MLKADTMVITVELNIKSLFLKKVKTFNPFTTFLRIIFKLSFFNLHINITAYVQQIMNYQAIFFPSSDLKSEVGAVCWFSYSAHAIKLKKQDVKGCGQDFTNTKPHI